MYALYRYQLEYNNNHHCSSSNNNNEDTTMKNDTLDYEMDKNNNLYSGFAKLKQPPPGFLRDASFDADIDDDDDTDDDLSDSSSCRDWHYQQQHEDYVSICSSGSMTHQSSISSSFTGMRTKTFDDEDNDSNILDKYRDLAPLAWAVQASIEGVFGDSKDPEESEDALHFVSDEALPDEFFTHEAFVNELFNRDRVMCDSVKDEDDVELAICFYNGYDHTGHHYTSYNQMNGHDKYNNYNVSFGREGCLNYLRDGCKSDEYYDHNRDDNSTLSTHSDLELDNCSEVLFDEDDTECLSLPSLDTTSPKGLCLIIVKRNVAYTSTNEEQHQPVVASTSNTTGTTFANTLYNQNTYTTVGSSDSSFDSLATFSVDSITNTKENNHGICVLNPSAIFRMVVTPIDEIV